VIWPEFDGVLGLDRAELDGAADDFGHLVRHRPAAVLRAGSVDDVVRLVRHARRFGLHIAPRGAGHTTFGQAQTEGGVVVDLRQLDQLQHLTRDTVTVGAGMSWRALVAHTAPAGLIPPVLPDFLDLTVGGTLAAGGISGTSFRWGAQVDNVDEVVVVTGSGDLVACSTSREPDLFNAVLAGFGQVGIIVSATIRLVSAPDLVEVVRLPYDESAAMVRRLRSLVGDRRFDYLLGIVTPTESGRWAPSIEAAVERRGGQRTPLRLDDLGHRREDERSELQTLADWVARVDEPVGVLRRLGLWEAPHPWLDVFVPGSAIEPMLSAVFASSVSRGVGPLRILLYPLCRSRLYRPMLRLPDEEDFFLLDVLSTAPAGGARAMLSANRSLFERNRQLGGTLYPISAVRLREEDWRHQLGRQWPELLAAKRRFDPSGILARRTGFLSG
jgi:cytokinin dehydrogenase